MTIAQPAWPVPREEQVAGNFRCMNNSLACRLMEDPWGGKEGSMIIKPDTFDDSKFLSMVCKVLARGPGYRVKRKKSKIWRKGSKKWDTVTEDLAAKGHSPYYVGDVAVGGYYFLKMPWVKADKVWVRGLRESHPEDAERIEYLDRLEAAKSSPLSLSKESAFQLVLPDDAELAKYGNAVKKVDTSFSGNITSSTRHFRMKYDPKLDKEVPEHRLIVISADLLTVRFELEEGEDESIFKQVYRGDQLSAM